MSNQEIKLELKRLQQRRAEIESNFYLLNVRLEKNSPGGTASEFTKTKVKYARLRSGRNNLLPNGKKTQYVRDKEIPKYLKAIELGRELKQIVQQIAQLTVLL